MKIKFFTAVLLFILFINLSYSQQNYPLVEVMTNDQCSICPNAHNTLDNYLDNSNNSQYINLIFYHMSFPYSGDPFYEFNPEEADARHAYYGGVSATPKAYFNGSFQSNSSYDEWADRLDQLVMNDSPLNIELEGWMESVGGPVTIKSTISRIGTLQEWDLKFHLVVTENIDYIAPNGIYPQLYVMRDMIPDADGEDFAIEPGEEKVIEKTFQLDDKLVPDSLYFIVFIQGFDSKNVLQSAQLSFKDFVVISVDDEELNPDEFLLKQNYPNPFNPSTKIEFNISEESYVKIEVYNILGKKVSTLVNEKKDAGNYEINFSGEGLSAGAYIYKLIAHSKSEEYVSSKKMILLK